MSSKLEEVRTQAVECQRQIDADTDDTTFIAAWQPPPAQDLSLSPGEHAAPPIPSTHMIIETILMQPDREGLDPSDPVRPPKNILVIKFYYYSYKII